MTMSHRLSASMSYASFNVVSFFANDGALPPAALVLKNSGSISAKSPSACMRSISTEPTMPRHPTNPTSLISMPLCVAENLSDPPARIAGEVGARRSESWLALGNGFRDGRDHGVTHLAGADARRAFRPDVRGAQARGEHVLDGRLDPVGSLGLGQGIAEHHGSGQYCSQRVGNS